MTEYYTTKESLYDIIRCCFIRGKAPMSRGKVHLERTSVAPGTLVVNMFPKDFTCNKTGEELFASEPLVCLLGMTDGKFAVHSGDAALVDCEQSVFNLTCGEIELVSSLEEYDLFITYDYVQEHRKGSYYIRNRDGSFGCDVSGHFLKCNKCGRKILVEIGLFGISHNASIQATCVECVEINETFKKDYPAHATMIEQMARDFKEEA